MGSKSTPSTTTTVQKNEPLAEEKPYLTDIWADASNWRNNTKLEYFPDSTVVDWSPETKAAYEAQLKLAQDPNTGKLLTNAAGAANNILTGGAYSSQPGATLSGLQGTINTGVDPSLGVFGNIASGADIGKFGGTAGLTGLSNFSNQGIDATKGAIAGLDNTAVNQLLTNGGYVNSAMGGQTALADKLGGNTNSAIDMLKKTADGGYLDGNNPAITNYMSNLMEPLMAGYQNATAKNLSGFSGGGRLGSNAQTRAQNTVDENASKGMANAAANVAYANYNSERDRQQAAQGMIGTLNNTDINNLQAALGALSGTSDSQQGIRNNALSAGGALKNATSSLALQGAGQLGDQSVSEAGVQKSAFDSLLSAYNADRSNQLTAAAGASNAFQNDTQNMLAGKTLNANAATAQGNLDTTRAGQQLTAANSADSIYNSLFSPINQIKQVGAANENKAAAELQDAMNRYFYNQNAPITAMQQEMSLHNNNYGESTGSSTTPVRSNPAAQALGGATALAGMFK